MPHTKPKSEAMPSKHAPHIAIIDDDDIIFHVYRSYLSETFNLTTFTDPKRALEEITDDAAFDVVVSDLIMPGISGIQVLEELRNRKIEIPVIIATGYADKQAAVQALQLGAFSLLEKPLDSSQLFFMCQRAAVFHQLARHNSKLLKFYTEFFGKLESLEHMLTYIMEFKDYINDMNREKLDLERLKKALTKSA